MTTGVTPRRCCAGPRVCQQLGPGGGGVPRFAAGPARRETPRASRPGRGRRVGGRRRGLALHAPSVPLTPDSVSDGMFHQVRPPPSGGPHLLGRDPRPSRSRPCGLPVRPEQLPSRIRAHDGGARGHRRERWPALGAVVRRAVGCRRLTSCGDRHRVLQRRSDYRQRDSLRLVRGGEGPPRCGPYGRGSNRSMKPRTRRVTPGTTSNC